MDKFFGLVEWSCGCQGLRLQAPVDSNADTMFVVLSECSADGLMAFLPHERTSLIGQGFKSLPHAEALGLIQLVSRGLGDGARLVAVQAALGVQGWSREPRALPTTIVEGVLVRANRAGS
jgi:hypothetical protein